MADSKLDAVVEKLAANKAAALTGALALAMGLLIGVKVDNDDPDRTSKLEAIGSAIEAGSAVVTPAVPDVDSAAYAKAIREVRDLDPTAIDLLSPPVEPGAEVTTGVSLSSFGARIIGDVELVGPAAKAFVVLDSTCIDRTAPSDAGLGVTWCEVSARNDGPTSQRLTALIHFEASSP